MVVPCILELCYHCVSYTESDNVKYLRKLAVTLRDELMSRFEGVFVRVKLAIRPVNTTKLPFYDRVYIAAAILDPYIKLAWLDEVRSELDGDDEDKVQIKQEVQGIV